MPLEVKKPKLNIGANIARVEPFQYLKDAEIEDNTLVITKKDGTEIEFQGGGEESVTSVNGKIGDVVLNAADVGAAQTNHTHSKSQITDFPTIPSKTSQLQNDSDFVNSTALGTKVDKVSGKELSTNDYTNAAKAKVDAIPANPKYTDTIYDDTAIKGRISTIEGKEAGWDAKSDFSGSYSDLTNKPQIGGVTLQGNISFTSLIPSSGLSKTALDSSVQSSLDKADTAYQKPSGGILKSDLASAVQTSLGLADTALQTAPVTSVNGNTGAVTISVPTALSQLSADSTHRLVTDTEKSTWNAKGTYSKPASGIPASDLASGVIPDIENATEVAISTSISASSADTEIPSAKAVYTLFSSIQNGNGVSY